MTSLYALSVPTYRHGLKVLDDVLTEAERYAEQNQIELSELIEHRLAPDMLPLTNQVQIACDMPKSMAVRVGKVDEVRFEDDETTFEQLHQRIAKTLDFLSRVRPEDLDGKEHVGFHFHKRDVDGITYLLRYSLPTFYFHITTAYDILRSKGVPLGKRYYLGLKHLDEELAGKASDVS